MWTYVCMYAIMLICKCACTLKDIFIWKRSLRNTQTFCIFLSSTIHICLLMACVCFCLCISHFLLMYFLQRTFELQLAYKLLEGHLSFGWLLRHCLWLTYFISKYIHTLNCMANFMKYFIKKLIIEIKCKSLLDFSHFGVSNNRWSRCLKWNWQEIDTSYSFTCLPHF